MKRIIIWMFLVLTGSALQAMEREIAFDNPCDAILMGLGGGFCGSAVTGRYSPHTALVGMSAGFLLQYFCDGTVLLIDCPEQIARGLSAHAVGGACGICCRPMAVRLYLFLRDYACQMRNMAAFRWLCNEKDA